MENYFKQKEAKIINYFLKELDILIDILKTSRKNFKRKEVKEKFINSHSNLESMIKEMFLSGPLGKDLRRNISYIYISKSFLNIEKLIISILTNPLLKKIDKNLINEFFNDVVKNLEYSKEIIKNEDEKQAQDLIDNNLKSIDTLNKLMFENSEKHFEGKMSTTEKEKAKVNWILIMVYLINIKKEILSISKIIINIENLSIKED